MQFNHHALGHNACRVVPDFGNGAQQGLFFLFGCARAIFADANRHAVKLQKLGKIVRRIVLKHIQPRQRAKQPTPRRLHTAVFMPMHHPAHLPQRLTRWVIGCFEQQVIVVIPAKPALRNRSKARGHIQAALQLPCDFQRGKAMPHRIHQIHQQIIQMGKVVKIALRRLG